MSCPPGEISLFGVRFQFKVARVTAHPVCVPARVEDQLEVVLRFSSGPLAGVLRAGSLLPVKPKT
mgnify:CR=1 FL=1